MNHYININEDISNNNDYKIHKKENLKLSNINYYNSNINSRTIKQYKSKNIKDNKIINPYKVNSLSSQKNLKQMLNGIKNGIEEISNQMKNTDDKIENYIKKNYIKNKKSKKTPLSIKVNMPRPHSQHKAKFLNINNSVISNIKNNSNKKEHNKSTNISNITYQYDYTNNQNSNNISKLN